MEYIFYIRNSLHNNEKNNLYTIIRYAGMHSIIKVNEKIYNRYMTITKILDKNTNKNLNRLHYYFNNRTDESDINYEIQNIEYHYYHAPFSVNLKDMINITII